MHAQAPVSPPSEGLGRGRGLALLGALFVFKLVYLYEYVTKLPVMQGPVFDSIIYLRQARSILAGDFGDASLVAYSPLYGWFLAVTSLGQWPALSILAQLALGCVSAALVYRIARDEAGVTAGLAAAGLYAGFGLFLCWESKFMTETLALVLVLGAIAMLRSPSFRRGAVRVAVAAGVFAGLSILARASLLFAAPFFALAAAARWDGDGRLFAGRALTPRLRRTLAVCAGLGLVLGANGLWNRAHTGFFVPVIMVSDTVAQTTRAGHDDDFASLSRHPSGLVFAQDVLVQAEQKIRGTAPIAAPAADRPLFGVDLVGWLANAPRKLVRTLSDDEITYDYGYFGERTEIASLDLLPVSFGTIATLGLAGAFFRARRRGLRSLWVDAPYILGALVTTTLFHTSSRYRLGLVPPLVLLAGPGLVELFRIVDRRRRLVAVTVAASICLGFAWRTLTWELRAPEGWHLRVAQSAALAHAPGVAAARLRRAVELAPTSAAVWTRVAMLEPMARSGLRPPPVGRGEWNAGLPARPAGLE